MSNAIVAAQRWLFSVLSDSAALTAIVGSRIVGPPLGPPGTVYPIVFYTLEAAANNIQTIDANIVYSPLVYCVRMVGKVESVIPLEAGAAAIKAALHKASGTNVSGVICACVEESPFYMPEIAKDGFLLTHLGGLYRLYVQ